MQHQLTTYLRAGYPGLAVVSSEEARAEAEIATVCSSLNRTLHAWSSTEGLVDVKEGRITGCRDPLDALQLLEGTVANANPRQVVLLRDLQLHMEQTDPMLVRRLKDILRVGKAYGLPAPKGLLIVGIPGTGKSLTAKATAGAFGLPLLRLDMGRVFGGLVGQSEAALRSVIQAVHQAHLRQVL
jgi:hypothetical protein